MPKDAGIRIFISTGEISGDAAGARLAAAILRCCPQARLAGTGGARMAAAGVKIVDQSDHLGAVGFTEPFSFAPSIIRLFLRTRRQMREERPDVAVLIGHDVFNTLLARWLRRCGIRTVAYFPPTVWIWRSLARFISGSFDLILASFPEEEKVYRESGGRVLFVGHYLRDFLQPVTPEMRKAGREACGLADGAPVVGLMPGSRPQEIDGLLPLLLECAEMLHRRNPRIRFLLPLAHPSHEKPVLRQVCARKLENCLSIRGHSWEVMRCCDLLLAASGTATLEAALCCLPMVIVYRVSRLSMRGIRLLVSLSVLESETLGLPNLILRRMVVPELRQEDALADRLFGEARALLEDGERREKMRRDLAGIGELLGPPGGLQRAAAAILSEAAGREWTGDGPA